MGLNEDRSNRQEFSLGRRLRHAITTVHVGIDIIEKRLPHVMRALVHCDTFNFEAIHSF
jgi:hypothetical protein